MEMLFRDELRRIKSGTELKQVDRDVNQPIDKPL